MKTLKLAFLFFALFLLLPATASLHEPITTKVMFNKEVIRILARNCLGCHAPNKIKADIPLTTYEEARPWAKAIKEEVLEKRMMPFQAVKGYGAFQHDYVLQQREVELLVSWVEGGAPRGEAKDYPREAIANLIAGTAWPLGAPDLVLQPAEETRVPAGETVAKCFSLPTGAKRDRFLTAIDFQPGNGTVVERASIAIAPAGAPSNCDAAASSLAEWVPGQIGVRLPGNTAYALPAGGRLLLRVQYRGAAELAADRSRVGLYFTEKPGLRPIRHLTLQPANAKVPANEAAVRLQASQVLSEAAEAIAIRPLLFPFAKSLEATAIRPDGTIEVLILTRNYRFPWQPVYYFKNPVPLPRGTRIEVTAYLDNSDNNANNPNDPPRAIEYTDRLCELALAPAAVARQARR